VHALAFSSTGRTLAVASETRLTLWYQAANDPSYFWTTPALRPLWWPDPRPAVDFISFTSDGETLAAGGGPWLVVGPDGAEPRGFVRLYDRGGRLVRTLDDQSDGGRPVVFSPDGSLLACGDFLTGTLRLRDGRTGRVLRILKAHHGAIGWAAFSPDSALLATGCGDRDMRGEVELWNPRTGEHLESVGRHDGLVGALAFSPDGLRLASAGMDGVIRIWRGPGSPARR
jgi:WD40 repeat protein